MRSFILLFLAIIPFSVHAGPNTYQKNKAWHQELELMIKKQDFKIFKKFMSNYPRKPGLDLEEYRRAVFTLLKGYPNFFSSAAEEVYAGNHDCYLRWVALGDENSDQTIRQKEKLSLSRKLPAKVQIRFAAISKSSGKELRVNNCD